MEQRCVSLGKQCLPLRDGIYMYHLSTWQITTNLNFSYKKMCICNTEWQYRDFYCCVSRKPDTQKAAPVR